MAYMWLIYVSHVKVSVTAFSSPQIIVKKSTSQRKFHFLIFKLET